MIDNDDVDFAGFASIVSPGGLGLLFFILMLVLSYYACQNEEKCSQMTCPDGQAAKLMEHECLCVTLAQP